MFNAASASGSMLMSADVWSNIPPPCKLSRSFSTSSALPFLRPAPAALIYSTISFALFSAAASLMFTYASSLGASPSSAGASASAAGASSTGSAFLAAFFLGAAFLVLLAPFPFPLAADFGFPPPAFSIYPFLTSSTDLPDLSSSITSYNIDS